MNEVRKIPNLSDLVADSEMDLKENHLMVLLNQPPPDSWLVAHPMITGYRYLPIERVEYLLTRIFGKWWVEIKNVQQVANSMVVTVRVYVTNPVTNEVDWQDGVGAQAIQTDKGAGAMDWNHAKADGVQKAVPSAETYAIKDACDKFGKLFGKDVSRKNQISYDSLLKSKDEEHGDAIK
jgi:recombination DNA repair RAD52 pathway protein